MAKKNKFKISEKSKKNLSLAIRIFISIALFSVLIALNYQYLRDIPDILKDSSLIFVFLGILFYFLGIACEAPRWKILLSSHNIKIPLSYLFNSVFIGFFFGTLLPTSVGGDAYRGVDLHRSYKVPLNENISSIYMGRFLGLLSGIFCLIVSFLFGMYKYLNKYFLIGFLITLPIIFLMIFITIFPKKFKIDVLFKKIKFLSRFSKNITSFSDVLEGYKLRKKELIFSFLLSILGNICTFISFYFIGLSLKVNLGFISYMFIIPIMWTAANIPITLGGFGVRENTLVLLLREFNVPQNISFTFSLIVLITNILISVFGGIVYVLTTLVSKRKKVIDA